MSWSTNVGSCPSGEVTQRLRTEFTRTYPTPSSEVLDQFEVALKSVELLLPSVHPASEPAQYYFSVSLSGHANKDHKKDPAWANDSVSISIYQE